MITMTKEDIFKDMRILFWCAVKTNKLTTALRVIELRARFLGMFEKQRLPEVKGFSDMTQEQLRDFIAVLEENDPELKDQGEEFEGYMQYMQEKKAQKEAQKEARKEVQGNRPPPELTNSEAEPAEDLPKKEPRKGARLWDGFQLIDYEVWSAEGAPKKELYGHRTDPGGEHPPDP